LSRRCLPASCRMVPNQYPLGTVTNWGEECLSVRVRTRRGAVSSLRSSESTRCAGGPTSTLRAITIQGHCVDSYGGNRERRVHHGLSHAPPSSAANGGLPAGSDRERTTRRQRATQHRAVSPKPTRNAGSASAGGGAERAGYASVDSGAHASESRAEFRALPLRRRCGSRA
jgi:hypothetical protein